MLIQGLSPQRYDSELWNPGNWCYKIETVKLNWEISGVCSITKFAKVPCESMYIHVFATLKYVCNPRRVPWDFRVCQPG